MHHLIFEGAELAGKSWIMSQIYDRLEPKYNQNKVVLDGCHWFNCDVGVFGTKHGRPIIDHYLNIFNELKDKNILIEKFHLADIINNRLHFQRELDYSAVENRLSQLGFKIVLIAFPEDEATLEKRIQDRLNLYPHYERILRDPSWYIGQQQEYFKELQKTKLDHLIVRTNTLPDQSLVDDILGWVGE
jgi:hypothetical protein